MPSWIRNNIATLLSIITIVVLMTIQWAGFQATAELAKDLDQRQRAHEQDNSRHIDQFRDEQRWRDLQLRLDRIEDKLDGRQ